MKPLRIAFGSSLLWALVLSVGLATPCWRAHAAASRSKPVAHHPTKRTRATPPQLARPSVVMVLRKGRPLGLGLALRHDDRIVAPLALFADGADDISIRYWRHKTVRVTVSAQDAPSGLALLTPVRPIEIRGLPPAHKNEGTRLLSVFVRVGARIESRPLLESAANKGGTSSGADPLSRFKIPPQALGSPVVTGRVRALGVVVRRCKPGTKSVRPVCDGQLTVARVGAIRRLLRRATAARPWELPQLGVRVTVSTAPLPRGLRVRDVRPGSLAARAGLRGPTDQRAGDVILAVDGEPVTSEVHLQEVLEKGKNRRLQLLLWRNGKFVIRTLTLTATGPKPPGAQRRR